MSIVSTNLHTCRALDLYFLCFPNLYSFLIIYVSKEQGDTCMQKVPSELLELSELSITYVGHAFRTPTHIFLRKYKVLYLGLFN